MRLLRANLIEPPPQLRYLLIQVHESSVCCPAAKELPAALRDLRCAGIHNGSIRPAQHAQRPICFACTAALSCCSKPFQVPKPPGLYYKTGLLRPALSQNKLLPCPAGTL